MGEQEPHGDGGDRGVTPRSSLQAMVTGFTALTDQSERTTAKKNVSTVSLIRSSSEFPDL